MLAPAPNSTVGSPTEISFKLTSGDYRYELVNLNLLSFRLDGVEQSSNALVLSELSEKMEEGVDLETLTLSLNPSLSPGLHTVEVSAHTGHDQPTKDNSTTATWSFTVAGDTKSADRN